MFLYAKYFLVFMSISMLSFLSAMDIPKEEKVSNIFSRQKPISIFSGEPSSLGSSLIPVSKNSIVQIEERNQTKDINDHLEKEQLQNIKNLLLEGLDADPNFFKIGPLKTPVICAAAAYGDVELVKLLLERGADINANDFLGNTALYASVSNGNDFIREYLLQKGADPNIISGPGVTPLCSAIFKCDASAIKSLIKYGANVDYYTANKFVGKNYCTRFNLKKEYYSHIKTVLLVLKKCNEILYNNHDLRFLILSYLPEYHCHPGLYRELQNRKCEIKPFALHVVDGHTKIVQDILQVKNKDDKNIFELFPSITKLNEKLLSDAAEFKQKYPNISSIQQSNLAFGILEQYTFQSGYKSLIPKDILLALEKKQVLIIDNFSKYAHKEIVRLDSDER